MNSEKVHGLQKLITTAGTSADNLKEKANWTPLSQHSTLTTVRNIHAETQECIALVKDTLLILSELVSYINTEIGRHPRHPRRR